ncbi:type IV pilus secretin PilQ [Alkalilimnicola ehrlichii MLHE-1]|uniref:Type IV pilus secretin PilQ n=1 Tax=Alkalilimnicola ehrlichii (strain ATCC BAA-1101 / DSM 17681 / MLHE-1) TaxID=187272 RepID=Q0A4Y8_ALKEH|nr:type IV pilus secretin family protein [Alkalilimnicola ehrlichii]ABI58099.1 type IV pilus secretin PilQ [Alkalilimnicola ehrlichii MLHE-1]
MFAKAISGRSGAAPDRLQGLFIGLLALTALACGLTPVQAGAATVNLTDMEYTTAPGNRVELILTLDGEPPEPGSFTISNPARLVVDLRDTRNRLAERALEIDTGNVRRVTTTESGDRTRLAIQLSRLVDHAIRVEGNQIFITLDGGTGAAARIGRDHEPRERTTRSQIEDIDFRRTPDEGGRIIIALSDGRAPVRMDERSDRVVLEFPGSRVPEELRRRLDVTDFATPVQMIETRQQDDRVRMTVTARGPFRTAGYQTADSFTLEIDPRIDDEEVDEPTYTGDPITLDFQDVEVRRVLQILADFNDMNAVISDSVDGRLTLRLVEVPWDHALEIILEAQGLDVRERGNVLTFAPTEELAARDRAREEARRTVDEVAPLSSAFIQVNYARAEDIANLLKGDETSLLSERGQVAIDERTNLLIVQDMERNIDDIRNLVNRLDIPVQQVLIESRIVIADDDFSRDLGVRFGYTATGSLGSEGTAIGARPTPTPGIDGTDDLMVDLPAPAEAPRLGLAIGRIGDRLLQLELSAMETEGRGEVISSPRVITANQREANIRQGVEIPYQEETASGATNVEFKEAVLGLTVTPQITPDDRVIMNLEVSNDTVGEVFAGVPSIDTQSVTTQVLVDNGETVVLGGVYERASGEQTRRVPFFGSLPGVGWLFRNRLTFDEQSELLVFVTPRILDESLNARNAGQ